MSGHYFTSMSFELREDVPTQVVSVLHDVARGDPPDESVLAEIHPVARYYLADWRRLVSSYEQSPCSGTPLRIANRYAWMSGRDNAVPCLSIEWFQHDDEYANGGYMFDLWVKNLVYRPGSRQETSPGRYTIGWSALYPNDGDAQMLYVEEGGFSLPNRGTVSFDQFDETWDSLNSDRDWVGFNG